MAAKLFLRVLAIFLAFAIAGIGILCIPVVDRRIVALIGMVFFFGLTHLFLRINKGIIPNGVILILSLLWILLFPFPYILLHPWTLPTCLVINSTVTGVFAGYGFFITRKTYGKVIILLFAICYYLLFNIAIYPSVQKASLFYLP